MGAEAEDDRDQGAAGVGAAARARVCGVRAKTLEKWTPIDTPRARNSVD